MHFKILIFFFLSLGTFVAQEDLFVEIRRLEDVRQYQDETFRTFFQHPSPWIRERAAIALGRIQAENSTALLKEALDAEEEPRVLESLIFAAGQLHSQDLVSSLLMRMPHATSPRIRSLLCEALGKIPPAKNATNEENSKETKPSPVELVLLKALRDVHPEVRASAIFAIFRQKSTHLSSHLEALYPDPSPDVSWKIIYTLMQLKQESALPVFLKALSDENPWARLFASRGLKKFLPAPEVLQPLLQLTQDPDIQVATSALTALEGNASLVPVSLLQTLTTHTNFHIRTQVAKLLGEQHSSKNIPVLLPLLKDPYETVKSQALESLTKTAPELGASFFEELWRSERTPDHLALVSASKFLPEKRKKRWLTALSHDKNALVRAAAFEALLEIEPFDATLLHGLNDEDLAVRGTLIWTLHEKLLANTFSQEIRQDLLKQFEHTYEQSQRREDYEIRELLLKIFREQKHSAESYFQKGLEDDSFAVRQEAFLGLQALQKNVEPPSPPKQEPSPFLTQTLPLAPKILIQTNRGEIKVKLFPVQAPLHVANLLQLIQRRFYQNLTIHRVVPGFVIQGGDPLGNGWGDPGYTLRDEINMIPYERGTLGMPKAGKDTGGCQFFFTHLPTPHLDGNYTVFGQIVEGFDVLDQIEVGDVLLDVRISP